MMLFFGLMMIMAEKMGLLGLIMMGFVVLCQMKGSAGLRFVIDREECFSHDAKYEGDTVHVSFVVIKIDSTWHYAEEGVDLVVWSIFVCLAWFW